MSETINNPETKRAAALREMEASMLVYLREPLSGFRKVFTNILSSDNLTAGQRQFYQECLDITNEIKDE